MACSSGCPTQDHETWGDCIRSKSLTLSGLESLGQDRTANKKLDKELSLYREARAGGVQPASTKTADSIKAMEAAS